MGHCDTNAEEDRAADDRAANLAAESIHVALLQFHGLRIGGRLAGGCAPPHITLSPLRRQPLRHPRLDRLPRLSACRRGPRPAIKRPPARRNQHRPESASTLRSARLGLDTAQWLAGPVLKRPVVRNGRAVCPRQSHSSPVTGAGHSSIDLRRFTLNAHTLHGRELPVSNPQHLRKINTQPVFHPRLFRLSPAVCA